VVSEAFELFDQAPGLAFGVAGGEVVGAEVVVGAAGREDVPDDDQEFVATAMIAFFFAAGLRKPPNFMTLRR
jgi:hypothetical protein